MGNIFPSATDEGVLYHVVQYAELGRQAKRSSILGSFLMYQKCRKRRQSASLKTLLQTSIYVWLDAQFTGGYVYTTFWYRWFFGSLMPEDYSIVV